MTTIPLVLHETSFACQFLVIPYWNYGHSPLYNSSSGVNVFQHFPVDSGDTGAFGDEQSVHTIKGTSPPTTTTSCQRWGD